MFPTCQRRVKAVDRRIIGHDQHDIWVNVRGQYEVFVGDQVEQNEKPDAEGRYGSNDLADRGCHLIVQLGLQFGHEHASERNTLECTNGEQMLVEQTLVSARVSGRTNINLPQSDSH